MRSTATAEPDTVLPPDAEAIMDDALAEEGPPATKGVRLVGPKELRFQRRMTAIFTIVPLAGVVASVVALWGWGISGLDLGLLVGFYVITVIGVTVGFHRLFTHRSFEVPLPVRAFLGIAGSMAVQGGITGWVANHRRHHAYADEYGDPHSPHLVKESGLPGVMRGLWHAHVGWLFIPTGTLESRWAPDLEREPLIAGINRWFPAFVVASFALPPIIAFAATGSVWAAVTAFIWGTLVRMFLLQHVTWSINSICHFFGKQPFLSKDESTNNWPLSLISFGESWHNNHHAFPTSARHGLLRGQLDLSWMVIRTMEILSIARRVRLPKLDVIQRKWSGPPKRLAG